MIQFTKPFLPKYNYGKNIELIFQYLDELLEKNEHPRIRKQIGFTISNYDENINHD